jgi:hypothetical protein
MKIIVNAQQEYERSRRKNGDDRFEGELAPWTGQMSRDSKGQRTAQKKREKNRDASQSR